LDGFITGPHDDAQNPAGINGMRLMDWLGGGGSDKAVRGRAGVRRYLREIDEQFDQWTMAIEDWRDAGDRVAALGHVRLHGRRSGVTFDQPVGILFEIRGGQLFRFETFLDEPADALKALDPYGATRVD
jgi:ketosteroid isomerase-like protein